MKLRRFQNEQHSPDCLSREKLLRKKKHSYDTDGKLYGELQR